MKRLIVPPLPAASRPSNSTTIFSPASLTQFCAFRSSAWSGQHPLQVMGFGDLRLVGIVASLEPAPDGVGIVAQRLDLDPVGALRLRLLGRPDPPAGQGRGDDDAGAGCEARRGVAPARRGPRLRLRRRLGLGFHVIAACFPLRPSARESPSTTTFAACRGGKSTRRGVALVASGRAPSVAPMSQRRCRFVPRNAKSLRLTLRCRGSLR